MGDRFRFPTAMALGVAMLIGCGLAAPSAQAGYVVTLTQVGTDIVANGGGPIDLTGLRFIGTGLGGSSMGPSEGIIFTGAGGLDLYSGFTGPGSFGSGVGTLSFSSSGDFVAIDGLDDFVGVPTGYVSDSPLSDTATYLNQTFASVGATPGRYEWTWGTGANQNFTLDIGVPVPEPAGWALFLTGFAALGVLMRSRRRMATASI